jgi:tetratricopeptide (TPR) repeat protein
MTEPRPSPEPVPTGADSVSPDVARQVEALAEEFLDQLHGGAQPQREVFVAAHPEIADLLNRRLRLVEMLHRLGPHQESDTLAPRAEATANHPPPAPASDILPTVLGTPENQTERTLRFKCPHCGNRIELVQPLPPEILCLSCGRTFPREAAAPATLATGDLPRQIGKFEILALRGQGSFGAVYKAHDPELERPVALKVPRPGTLATAEQQERFLREARSAARLKHPHIVQVHEIGHDWDLPYIVSEYIDGLTLADLLTGGLPRFPETAALVARIAEALDYAHQQKVIHRDVKPSNILLDRAGRPYVSDFGLARRDEGDQTLTLEGQILGTPAYMSPEQAAGDQRQVDAHTDIYSLGVVLYELLTGELPFRGNTHLLLHQVLHEEPRPVRSLNHRIPRDLETICLKAMAKVPARRYATAGEMADDLGRFLRGEPIRARRLNLWQRSWSWAKRRPALAALLGVSILAAASLLAVSLGFNVALNARAAEAQRERDRAETNLHRALQAVDEMLTQVAQEQLLHEPRMEQTRRALLERALRLYREFLAEDSAHLTLRKETGLAYKHLADVLRQLGQPDPAEEAYGQAITLLGRLAAEFPHWPGYRQQLADSYNWLGELRRTSTRLVDAEPPYRQALRLQQGLMTEHPDEPQYQLERARTLYNLGLLQQALRRSSQAGDAYAESIHLLQDLTERFPTRPAYRQELARVHINRGIFFRQTDRRPEAEEAYGKAGRLLEQLVGQFPKVPEYRHEWAVSTLNLGNLLLSTPERRPDVARHYRQAVTLLERLVADFPGVPVYRKDLANSYNSLGNGLVAGDDGRAAEQAWQQARRHLEQLLTEFPPTSEFESLLGLTLGNLGWLKSEQAERTRATQMVLAGVAAAQSRWDGVLETVDTLSRYRAELAEARHLQEQAVLRQQAALRLNPQSADYQARLKRSYKNLAQTLQRLGAEGELARLEAERRQLDAAR